MNCFSSAVLYYRSDQVHLLAHEQVQKYYGTTSVQANCPILASTYAYLTTYMLKSKVQVPMRSRQIYY